jgi:hypothetical protein
LPLPAPGEVPAAAGLTAAPRGGGNAEPDL